MRWLRTIHKVFKPNCECEICAEPKCHTCNLLEELLDHANRDKDQLLNIIYNFSKDQVVEDDSSKEEPTPQPIAPRVVPWHIKRAEMERADRAIAEQRKTQSIEDKETEKRIKELEKELGLANEVDHAG